jgi:hypothetical protein
VIKRTDAVANLTAVALMLMAMMLLSSPAPAQEQTKGDASLRIEYQCIQTGGYPTDELFYGGWTTDSHVLLLSGTS